MTNYGKKYKIYNIIIKIKLQFDLFLYLGKECHGHY